MFDAIFVSCSVKLSLNYRSLKISIILTTLTIFRNDDLEFQTNVKFPLKSKNLQFNAENCQNLGLLLKRIRLFFFPFIC